MSEQSAHVKAAHKIPIISGRKCRPGILPILHGRRRYGLRMPHPT